VRLRKKSPTETAAGLRETCWGLFQVAPVKSRVLGLIMTRAWLGFQAAVGDWMLTWTSWPGAADKLREKLRVARDGMMLMTDGRIMPCRLSLLSDICDALMMCWSMQSYMQTKAE